MIVNPFTREVLVVNHPGHADQSVHGSREASRIGEEPGATYRPGKSVYHVTKKSLIKKILAKKGGLKPGTTFHDTLDESPAVPRTYVTADKKLVGPSSKFILDDPESEDLSVIEIDPSFTGDWEKDPNLEIPAADKARFLSLRKGIPRRHFKSIKSIKDYQ